jgi:hypothetical protein
VACYSPPIYAIKSTVSEVVGLYARHSWL